MSELMSAEAAKALAGYSGMATINEIIKKRAENGHPGVWLTISITESIKLKGAGYTLTPGSSGWTGKGDNREGQTWIYWGN